MMEKFNNKYRIPSARLHGYDYGSNGFYFVTICTKNRVHYFGNIVDTDNCPSPTNAEGINKQNVNIMDVNIHDINIHNNNPSHLDTGNCPYLYPTIIGKIAIDYWTEIPKHYPFVELDEFVVMPNHIHGILFFNKPITNEWQPNKFGVQSQNLGAVIRGFKSSTKRYANENNIKFEWQTRFHDSIIRNEKQLNAIRKYIINNPMKWKNDALNLPQLVDGFGDNNTPSPNQIIENETENLFKNIIDE